MPIEQDYTRALEKLLPRGRAWCPGEGSTLGGLLAAFGQVAASFHSHVLNFVEDVFPDTTINFLTDWERVAGLPLPCSGLAETIPLRRQDLLARLTARGQQTIEYFIGLAATLGYEITIDEFDPFVADEGEADAPLYEDDWQFVWQVNAPLETVQEFEADHSGADDPLAIWGNTRLECLLNLYKPAHTLIIFAYS